jgi:hypothetical protein
MAIEDDSPLFEQDIYISQKDIEEINLRFSTKNSKLCALGILLFAKAHADKDGTFTFSQSDFANWVGIQQPHVSTCFDELELFDYIKRIHPNGDQTFVWNGRIVGKRISYKLKVDYSNIGEYKIENNDIRDIFNKIFS